MTQKYNLICRYKKKRNNKTIIIYVVKKSKTGHTMNEILNMDVLDDIINMEPFIEKLLKN